MQDNINEPILQGKGGAGRGQGRKQKISSNLNINIDEQCTKILSEIEGKRGAKTLFVESAIKHYNNYLNSRIEMSEEYFNLES